MEINEIPLTPNNQRFNIQLTDTVWQLRIIWRDGAGWILDILDSAGEAVILGLPLLVNENLLAQYKHIVGEGKLILLAEDENALNEFSLGSTVKLYWLMD